MKTSPQHFQWILHVALSLTQSGVTLEDGRLSTQITEFLLSALWNLACGNFILIYVWDLQNTTCE